MKYRTHQLHGNSNYHARWISRLSNAGVAIGLYTKPNTDFAGVVAWEPPYVEDTAAIAFHRAPKVFVFAVNDAGQFVGRLTKGGDDQKAIFGSLRGTVPVVAQSRPHDQIGSAIVAWRNRSVVWDINSSGAVAGCRFAKGRSLAFLGTPNGELIDLEPPVADASVAATSLNDAGFVAGCASGLVLVWSVDGSIVEQYEGKATSVKISNAGHILYQSHLPGLVSSARVVRPAGHVPLDPAPGCRDSVGNAINASGWVAGEGRPNFDSTSGMTRIACLWDAEGVAYDINQLVDDASIRLSSATSINDAGWIACIGRRRGDTYSSPFLLQPSG